MNRSAQIPIFKTGGSRADRIGRLIATLIIVGFIGIAAYCTLRKSPANEKYIPVAQLISEFRQIIRPPQAIANGDLRTHTKGLMTSVEQSYFWPPGSPSLLESYRGAVSAQGWRDLMHFQGGIGVAEIFCKGGMEASLQEMQIDANGTSSYNFSIANGEMSATECAQTRP